MSNVMNRVLSRVREYVADVTDGQRASSTPSQSTSGLTAFRGPKTPATAPRRGSLPPTPVPPAATPGEAVRRIMEDNDIQSPTQWSSSGFRADGEATANERAHEALNGINLALNGHARGMPASDSATMNASEVATLKQFVLNIPDLANHATASQDEQFTALETARALFQHFKGGMTPTQLNEMASSIALVIDRADNHAHGHVAKDELKTALRKTGIEVANAWQPGRAKHSPEKWLNRTYVGSFVDIAVGTGVRFAHQMLKANKPSSKAISFLTDVVAALPKGEIHPTTFDQVVEAVLKAPNPRSEKVALLVDELRRNIDGTQTRILATRLMNDGRQDIHDLLLR